jgi:hypothetical protein
VPNPRLDGGEQSHHRRDDDAEQEIAQAPFSRGAQKAGQPADHARSSTRSAHHGEQHSDAESDQHRCQRITLDTGLDFAACRANPVLRVGGGAYDLVPGSLRLMSHQLAHRFGQTRDVLPEGGQIRGEVSGSAFSVLGHGNLQHEKASDVEHNTASAELPKSIALSLSATVAIDDQAASVGVVPLSNHRGQPIASSARRFRSAKNIGLGCTMTADTLADDRRKRTLELIRALHTHILKGYPHAWAAACVCRTPNSAFDPKGWRGETPRPFSLAAQPLNLRRVRRMT